MTINIVIGLNQHHERSDEFSQIDVDTALAIAFIYSFAVYFEGNQKTLNSTPMYLFKQKERRKQVNTFFVKRNHVFSKQELQLSGTNIFINLDDPKVNALNAQGNKFLLELTIEHVLGPLANYGKAQLKHLLLLLKNINSKKAISLDNRLSEIFSEIYFANKVAEQIIENSNHTIKNQSIIDARREFLNKIHVQMLNNLAA